MFSSPQGITLNVPRGVKAVTLAASLVFSASLTAVALRTPDDHWLAWISFLPLFVAVRWLRPPTAALAGGLWGACLYVFCIAGPAPAVHAMAPAIDPTVPAIGPACLLALLIVIPAVYVGLAAWPARLGATALSAVTAGRTTRKRHCSQSSGTRPARTTIVNLLTLALGWTLLEVVLVTTYPNTLEPRASARADVPREPRASARAVSRNLEPRAWARAVLQDQDDSDSLLNRFAPHDRLLTGSQAEGPHLPWLARLLAYVSTAFLVACTNASLVSILSGARLSFPAYRSLAGSPNAGACPSSQVVLSIQSWTLRETYPRAPPNEVAVPSWNVVGSAHRG